MILFVFAQVFSFLLNLFTVYARISIVASTGEQVGEQCEDVQDQVKIGVHGYEHKPT